VKIPESFKRTVDAFWDWFLEPRPCIFVAIFCIGCLLEIVFHLVLNTSVAYTHFFYLIIVLAGLWYPDRAVLLAVFFGGIYGIVEFIHTGTISGESLFRILILCLVAIVVSSIARRMMVQKNQLQDSQDALALANKKLNLLSGITRHDINNQLTGLLGYLELSKDTGTDPKMLEYITREEVLARTIQREIAFTKDYEEIGLHVPQWQNVAKILRADWSSRQPGIVILNTELDGLEVYADPLLEKIFGNLIDNSLRHGKKVSQIRISYAIHDPDLVLIYEDNGVGIPESDKDHIFEKGFGRHTGMGLFLSREILNITGLSIRETGTRGEGARFEIALPSGRFRFR